MATVIMSPLSELTDTDGFEMHSASQWALALPALPPPRTQVCQAPLCRVLGYPGVMARPSSTAQPASREAVGLFGRRVEGGYLLLHCPPPPPYRGALCSPSSSCKVL